MDTKSVVPEKPRKLTKRKKLRRLAAVQDKNNNYHKKIGIAVFAALIGLSMSLLLAHFTRTSSTEQGMLNEFVNSYRKHYNQIVHGSRKKDYCNSDENIINSRIILHQDLALQQLEMALRNVSNLNSIAIVGPVGVGKSTWSRGLEDNFHRENVHSYAWNAFVMNEAEKFRAVRMFVENFSDCGSNLLVIDNLRPCDVEVVAVVNKLIAESIGGKDSKKRVVAIYIFSAATSVELQLPNTRTVHFKGFGIEELKDCIRLEALEANLTLTVDAFDEIVDTIDVHRSGCKNVRAKVLSYGKATT